MIEIWFKEQTRTIPGAHHCQVPEVIFSRSLVNSKIIVGVVKCCKQSLLAGKLCAHILFCSCLTEFCQVSEKSRFGGTGNVQDTCFITGGLTKPEAKNITDARAWTWLVTHFKSRISYFFTDVIVNMFFFAF